ncbi:MAG TPA: MFS transporter [Terriglobales bacterium]|jgi:fucose permease
MNSSALSDQTGSSSAATLLVHVNFLLTGIVMTFLGPLLPLLTVRWGINDALAGRLFLVQFVSSMLGMFCSAPAVRRYGYRTTFIVGLALMATGISLLGAASYWIGVIAVGVLGAGHGITTPAGNLRTAEVNPQRSASALNVINAVWGIGAMSPAFLIDLARKLQHPAWFLYGTAIALAALLLAFAIFPFVPDSNAAGLRPGASQSVAWPKPSMLLLIGAIFFLYVGAETAFGQWVATYAHRLEPGRSLWTMMPSFFYGALLAGRISAPLALRFVPETTVASTGLTLAFLGGLALLGARGLTWIIPGSLLAGFGLASIFPISVSLFPRWFRESARSASGAVFASGNMGGAVLPWLVGIISTHFGSLRLGFFVPLAAVSIMLAFYIAQEITGRRLQAGTAQFTTSS